MSKLTRPTARYMTTILVDGGIVTERQIELAVLRQRETGRRIGETLIEMGAVTEQDIAWALSRQLGFTYVDVEPTALDHALVHAFPESLLRRLRAVPLLRDGQQLTVALSDPLDFDGIAALERAGNAPISVCVATGSAVDAALDAVFGVRVARPRGYDAATAAEHDILWDSSGVSFLLFHVTTALQHRISEVHFLPGGGQLHVYHRHGLQLVRVASESAPVLDYLLDRLEQLGVPPLGDDALRVARVRCPIPTGHAAIEVSLLRGEEGVAVRVAPRPEMDAAPSLEALGMDAVDVSELRALLEAQAGLVVVCGPPGAGVTTTLAAIAGATDAARSRVVVFEPAALSPIPHATRIHLPPERAAAVWEQAAIAQNADVVVLDGVLAGDGITAALSPAGSGRLLLASTDWSNSLALVAHLAATARGRSVLADRLVAVIQQRTVAALDGRDAADAGEYRPVVFEVLLASEPVRDAIRSGADAARLAQVAHAQGFRTLADRLRERVESGNLDALAAARALT